MIKFKWLGDQDWMLGSMPALEPLGFQAFHPPSFKPFLNLS
jgi:hypothetical protein